MPQLPSEPAAGVLLIASANMVDPNFARTVILLCEHNEQGSFGLVLNRPLPLKLSDGIAELYDWDAPLFQGGPVQPGTLHFLHRRRDLEFGSREVMPGLFWGGEFDRVNDALRGGRQASGDFRFFVGYSGWGQNQLASEMERDAWYLQHATADRVFDEDVGNIWRKIVATMGSEYAMLRNFPDDPRLN